MPFQDEAGTLLASDLPDVASASDDKLMESLGAPTETTPQAAVTGGGAFKHLACNLRDCMGHVVACAACVALYK